MNNTEYQAEDDGTENKWNNLTMGNYWSDFDYNYTYYLISGTANSTVYYPMNLNKDEKGEDSNIIGYSGLMLLSISFICSCILYKKARKKTEKDYSSRNSNFL